MSETLREAALRGDDRNIPKPSDRLERRWWRIPPVDRHGLIAWVLAYVVMTAIVAAVGLLIVHTLGGVRSFDGRVEHWFEMRRTDTSNTVTWWGSIIADAYVKI